MTEKTIEKDFKDNSLETLLADFTRQNTKKDTTVKQEVNPPQSLKERAIRGMEQLANQKPYTLSQMRAQSLTVKIYSGEYGEYTGRKGDAIYLDESIKYDLRMYFPKFSEEQIDNVLTKLFSIYNESISYIKKTIEEKTEFEKSLEALLKDFAKHNKRANTAPKTEVNHPISLKDKDILGVEQFRQMRAQVLILSVKLFSVSGNKERKSEEIKHHLRMYFPKLSEEQIEDGLIKLYSIYNEQHNLECGT